ncbi:MAG TPA: alpha/beta fold hydrolase [Thermoanaerobaculia bacterium]|nr:alpha/beta fold hydrolase [Thermoanaerobaculia bacterium]
MSSLRAFGRPLGAGLSGLLLLLLPAPSGAGSLELRPCHLDGLAEQVRCGVLEVAENAAEPAGRRIPIHFAVVPAATRDVEPDPLVILAGGPGQAATGMARALDLGFREVRRPRDVLLVDLRGTGKSGPLTCPASGDVLTAAARGGGLGMEADECLRAQSADVRFYANEPAVADLDAVREALGYPRLNLWGGSYGTRTALVYARRYPERVRSVILDGAVAFSLRFPLALPRYADAALAQLLADCAAEPACRSAYPRLESELRELLARLAQAPERVTVAHPRSGEPVEVEVTEALVAVIVRGALYTPQSARLLPHAIHQAARGRFEPLFALSVETAGWSVDTMALGVTLAVLCTEDVPRVTVEEAKAAVAGYILGGPEVEQWLESCRQWPHGPLPARVDELLPLDVPALVLSGGLDPVTPPEAGELMLRHFRNGWHLVAPEAGHNASFSPCVPERMAEFIERASGEGLDLRCAEALPRPPFFVPGGGR